MNIMESKINHTTEMKRFSPVQLGPIWVDAEKAYTDYPTLNRGDF